MATPRKSERTREHILTEALRLFRRQGFDATSMRDIAAACDLSLGAAYYHFASKEALVLAYYARLQASSDEKEAALIAGATSLRQRLEIAFATKLAAVKRDRKIMVALTRMVADPESALSLFSTETSAVRAASIATFARAIAPELAQLSPSAQALLPTALWGLYLGVLLYYFHDRSRGAQRTEALLGGLLDLVAGLLPLAGTPFGAQALDQLTQLATQAGLASAR